MSKQTAVQWLLKKIEEKNGTEFSSYYTEFIEQAKAMEEEQIIEASHVMYMNGTTKYPITAEQYYTQTYGGDNAKGNS
jgi:hypothetical protein